MKTIINNRSGSSVFSLQTWKELIQYKDLLFVLVRRDVNAVYKQTIIGFAWAILRPVAQMVLFTIIFDKIMGFGEQVKGVPYPVFTYIALVPWTYFSGSLAGSSNSLVSNMSIFTKVYFPRLIIPFTPVIAKLVDFLIAFSLVFVMVYIFYGMPVKVEIIYLPILILMMIMTSFGVGLWLSTLSIQYRDVAQLMTFLIPLLMYMAPVIYPLSKVPVEYQSYYALYPMVGVIEGFRAAFIVGKDMPWDLILNGSVVSFVLMITGIIYFKGKEGIFADVA